MEIIIIDEYTHKITFIYIYKTGLKVRIYDIVLS